MRDSQIFGALKTMEEKVINDNFIILKEIMLSRARMKAIERILFPDTRWEALKLAVVRVISPETVQEWIEDKTTEIYLEQQEGIRRAKNETDKALIKPSPAVILKTV